MIGWIVEKTSSCGTRRYWSRFRLITALVSRNRPHGILRSAISGAAVATWIALMPCLLAGP